MSSYHYDKVYYFIYRYISSKYANGEALKDRDCNISRKILRSYRGNQYVNILDSVETTRDNRH